MNNNELAEDEIDVKIYEEAVAEYEAKGQQKLKF